MLKVFFLDNFFWMYGLFNVVEMKVLLCVINIEFNFNVFVILWVDWKLWFVNNVMYIFFFFINLIVFFNFFVIFLLLYSSVLFILRVSKW